MNIKRLKESVPNKLSRITSLWSASIATQYCYFASAETELGQGIETGSKKFVNEISAIYCGSIFMLLLIINVFYLALSKNEKGIGIAKKTLIGIVALYVILKLAGGSKIQNTMDTISGWVS